MKNWLRILFVGCVCFLTTLSFVSCAETTSAVEEGEKEPEQSTPTDEVQHSHVYGDWYIVTNPTCTEKGVERRDCTGECEAYETREVNATGHKISLTSEIPAKCEKTGSQTYSCSNTNCEYTFTEEIPALQHKHVLTAETPASCETEGSQTFTCTNDNCENSYNIVIPAIGHKFEFVKVVEPTCTENGYTLNKCHCGEEEHTNPQAATVQHEFNANHQCDSCGLHQSPMENLKGTYWYWTQNSSDNKWAIYIETLEGNQGTYCSYKGTYVDGVFTPTAKDTKYNGNFEVISSTNPDTGVKTYQIKFYDDYIKQQAQEGLVSYSYIFTMSFSGNETTGEFTLTGDFRGDKDNTFIFVGYKVS